MGFALSKPFFFTAFSLFRIISEEKFELALGS